MAEQSVLALVVLLLFQFPQPVVNGFDEDVQRRAAELEQGPPEPPDPGWGALLEAALQHWPFLAAAEVLLLPLCFWFWRRMAARRQRAAAMRQRAAARRAQEETLRHRMEIERRRLLFKRRYKDMKEMWRTMKVMKRKISRIFK